MALLGPNGAGKTTFLRILASLSRPSLGEVRIAGHRLPARPPRCAAGWGWSRICLLLYGDLTAEENLRFYGRMYGVSEPGRRVSEQALELVGLAAAPPRPGAHLFARHAAAAGHRAGRAARPGGDALRRAAHRPGPGCLRHAGRVLRRWPRSGRTVVMTSHDLARAADLATRFDVLSRGVIAASASRKAESWTPAELLAAVSRGVTQWLEALTTVSRAASRPRGAVTCGRSPPSCGRTWRPSCAAASCSRPCWSSPCW